MKGVEVLGESSLVGFDPATPWSKILRAYGFAMQRLPCTVKILNIGTCMSEQTV